MSKIIKLCPATKNYVWGGNDLKAKYNKKTDTTPLAETWELSVHPDGASVVSTGEFKGLTLNEYIEKSGKEVLGKNCERFDRFPILIKFIDAAKSLSVQVHPDDEYAIKNENDLGKTEVWYVLEAKPGAKIWYGFNTEVTPDEVRARIEDGTLCDVLGCYDSKKGDVFFIPAGTVHAIGEGNMICEVQENSNTTYRFFDYNRRDKDGNLRPLHIDKALEVTKLYPTPLEQTSGDIIAQCEYFIAKKITNPGKVSIDPDSFTSLIVTDGEGSVSASGSTEAFKKGDSIFIPAGERELEFCGSFEIVMTQV